MYGPASSTRAIGLAASSAMAAVLLAGCATNAAPRADLSAGKAAAALSDGRHAQAIGQAEAAVLAEPHAASYRVLLGQAYLEAGRFASAATSFDDAMTLGDRSPRTALSAAIALIGAGRHADAAELLDRHQNDIASADLGLALALAGQPDRGIALMSDAIRSGTNNAKIRQNLAYAYALDGRWREARLMTAQDVPANQVGERLEQWAMTIEPEAWQARVAGLLDVPVGVADAGQPVQLALANNPTIDQLAAEAIASAPPAAEAPTATELPALALVQTLVEPTAEVETVAPTPPLPVAAPAPLPATFQTAFAAPTQAPAAVPTPVAQSAEAFAPAPAMAVAPAAARAAAPAATRTAVSAPAPLAQGSHLVQLGSFASEASARRAWDIYLKRYPELRGHQMVISEAVVRGKNYWRVSAAGYNRSSSTAMCGRVNSTGGEGCFAYAEGRPLPGAIDRGTRLAMR